MHKVNKKLNKNPKLIITILKLVISCFLMYYLFSHINFQDAFAQIQRLSALTIFIILLIFLIQLLAISVRYHKALECMGIYIPLIKTIRPSYIGYFFSQTMISFVGGDAMRVLITSDAGEKITQITKAVVVDRLSGFAGQILLLALTIPFLIPLLPDIELKIFLLLIILGSCGLVLMVFFLGKKTNLANSKGIVGKLISYSNRILDRLYTGQAFLYIFGLSFLIGLINCIAYFAIAKALNIPLTFWQVLILTPPALFLSMMPISISGWGVREGGTVMMLAIAGISSSDALCISIIFGLSLLTISLPGGIIWLVSPKLIQSKQIPESPLP
jgi:uncharacterized membrane protein YbhN (UPF0104 family)